MTGDLPSPDQLERLITPLDNATRVILGSIGAGSDDHRRILLRCMATATVDTLERAGLLAHGELTPAGVWAPGKRPSTRDGRPHPKFDIR